MSGFPPVGKYNLGDVYTNRHGETRILGYDYQMVNTPAQTGGAKRKSPKRKSGKAKSKSPAKRKLRGRKSWLPYDNDKFQKMAAIYLTFLRGRDTDVTEPESNDLSGRDRSEEPVAQQFTTTTPSPRRFFAKEEDVKQPQRAQRIPRSQYGTLPPPRESAVKAPVAQRFTTTTPSPRRFFAKEEDVKQPQQAQRIPQNAVVRDRRLERAQKEIEEAKELQKLAEEGMRRQARLRNFLKEIKDEKDDIDPKSRLAREIQTKLKKLTPTETRIGRTQFDPSKLNKEVKEQAKKFGTGQNIESEKRAKKFTKKDIQELKKKEEQAKELRLKIETEQRKKAGQVFQELANKFSKNSKDRDLVRKVQQARVDYQKKKNRELAELKRQEQEEIDELIRKARVAQAENNQSDQKRIERERQMAIREYNKKKTRLIAEQKKIEEKISTQLNDAEEDAIGLPDMSNIYQSEGATSNIESAIGSPERNPANPLGWLGF